MGKTSVVQDVERFRRDVQVPASRSLRPVLSPALSRELRDSWPPQRTSVAAEPYMDELVVRTVHARRGETLFRAGDAFANLYAIRTGSCKALIMAPDGQYQITAYHIEGDVVGVEAVFLGAHDATVVTLEECELCVMPAERVDALSRRDAGFQRDLSGLLSQLIVGGRKVLLMLGKMRAEQRLAAFLLDLGDRYASRGHSSALQLSMTRQDIASHLGLTHETVSRAFSRFHQDGLIHIHGREVQLLDRDGLRRLVETEPQ
jgi:CRP/FNR family transcriptional regulator